MHQKTCGHKIDDKGLHLLIYLIHQNNSPLCCWWSRTKYLLILRASDMWTPSGLSFLGTFTRKKMAYVLIFVDALDMIWSMALVCSIQAYQNPSSSFCSALATQILDFSHQYLVGVSDFFLHIRVIIRQHTHNNYTSLVYIFLLTLKMHLPPYQSLQTHVAYHNLSWSLYNSYICNYRFLIHPPTLPIHHNDQ